MVRSLAGVVIAAALLVPLAAPAQASDVSITNWHEFVNLGGPTLTGGPGIWEPGGGSLLGFARGTDGKLQLRARSSFGWDPSEQFGQADLLDNPTVVRPDPGVNRSFEVYFRTPDNRIEWRGGIGLRGRWVDHTEGNPNVGGNVTSGPAVTKTTENRTDVFAKGANGQLQHTWRHGGQWAGWEDLGGAAFVGSPTALSWQAGNRIDIFATSQDNRLIHRWWTSTGGWTDWEDLGGTVTSGPSALMFSDSRMDVFAKGGSDQLVHRFWDAGAGWSGWESLGGDFQYAPAVNKLQYSGINVFVTGRSGQLEHNWWG